MIRVFVSSTFRDMQEEREELVKRVFPQLRKLCERRGVVWGEGDLRWGVTDEQRAEGQVLPICLAEIERCRPFFIVLLGERYGWVPDSLPPEVAAHAFFYFRDPAYIEGPPASLQREFREEALPDDVLCYGQAEAGRHGLTVVAAEIQPAVEHMRSLPDQA